MAVNRYEGTCKNIEAVVTGLAAAGLTVKATSATATVNGYVSTQHDPANHPANCWVEVGVYDADEAPNKEHETTLKKPAVMPSKTALKTIVEAAVA